MPAWCRKICLKLQLVRELCSFKLQTFFYLMKYPYSTYVFQLLSMNGGETLDFSGFQYTFVLCVMPGHYLHIMMGILWKYCKAFFSGSLPSYTIRRYHICSHYFNDFRKIIKNRIKVSHVTSGHYGRPFRNINIYFLAFMFGWYLGNFVNFLKFWFHISNF